MDGHEVMTASDGGEALDVISRADGGFDLLLTDIRMPIMDGIALALAAARDHPALTILLMTGYADQRERAHGLDAIIHDVISKPFSVATLRGAVTEALTVPRAAIRLRYFSFRPNPHRGAATARAADRDAAGRNPDPANPARSERCRAGSRACG